MKKHTGFKRIVNAAGYSYKGIRYAFAHEAAFRQEALAALVLIPLAFYLADSPLQTAMLLLPVFLVLIVELLNTAIEAVVDRIGLEHHDLAGAAKDVASAAVLISIILWALIWATVLLL